MEGLTQAVIYCRVSSDKQVRHGHGLDGQQARCSSYARERGLDVVKVFRDEAISGRLENRPAFNELINFIEASEESYVVIIDDLNRLARDVVVSRALKLLIKGSGSTLACVNFEFEDSPENNYFETIVVATGEYERRKNRQRVMSRQRARLEAGYWVFAPPKGYQYEKIEGHGKLLVPDEPNANLIHEVISKFASGELMTLTDARDFLEEGGLRNRSGKGISPTVEETKRILSRLIYAGYIEYKPWKVAEVVGHHEALVERGVFDAVQQRLAGRARAPTRSDLAKDFPLRSSVLCGECGTPLTGSWSTGRTKRYPYYRCPNTKSCPAQKKSIAKRRLESDFLHFLQSVCPQPGIVKLARRATGSCQQGCAGHRDSDRKTDRPARQVGQSGCQIATGGPYRKTRKGWRARDAALRPGNARRGTVWNRLESNVRCTRKTTGLLASRESGAATNHSVAVVYRSNRVLSQQWFWNHQILPAFQAVTARSAGKT